MLYIVRHIVLLSVSQYMYIRRVTQPCILLLSITQMPCHAFLRLRHQSNNICIQTRLNLIYKFIYAIRCSLTVLDIDLNFRI
jgi:hypothetical protein